MPKFPPPELPQWAAEAGCPAPKRGESFRSYVERLGLDFDDLVFGLDARTAELANLRLSSELHRRNPDSFARYLERRIEDAQERYSYQSEHAQADRQ
jgi:hypothetical protein